MSDRRCEKCGAELPAEVPSGVCPRCAMSLALGDTEGGGPDEPGGAGREMAGRRIGRYVLSRRLGEGGMGEVWLAEQQEPVRRQVALKIIKPGMDTEQFVARFEGERQALALMEHPAVARIFDAGSTDDGRPYLVMEYVPGAPITEYCDRERLTTKQRLELFRQVCDGVQHAHHKAILHRDLKPSNVLVSVHDDRATPKIIDFGVAKALDRKLTERSLFTELGVLVGTPEYMSPEQAEAGGEEVDTRTDVYSLGVLLYELLAGCLPFEPKELRAAGYEGIRRVIREQEPARPSMRVSTLGDAHSEPAAQRRTDPGSLSRQLRGDLDWIAMKALEKDPERRYGSPAELAADIARHLGDEPVLAGPPSASYRLQKFARRHRFGVALGATAALALIAILVLQTIGGVRLKRERDRANREAVTANRVIDFLTGLFEESNPVQARGVEMTAREILDRGTRTIDAGLADEPEIQARLMVTIGSIDIELGRYAEALSMFERSVELRRAALGPDHPDTLRSEFQSGGALLALGRSEEAEELLRSVFERQRAVLGESHVDPWESANYLAQALHGLGRREEALEWHLRAHEGYTALLGPVSELSLESSANVGLALKDLGRLDEAEPYYRRAVKGLRDLLGADHPQTIAVEHNLGMLMMTRGKIDEAEPYMTEAAAGVLVLLGNEHPNALIVIGNLGQLYCRQERFVKGAETLGKVVDAVRRVLPREHMITGFSIRKFGSCLSAAGRHDEAEPLLLEAVEILDEAVGPEQPHTMDAVQALVELYEDSGRDDEARRWRERVPD